MLGKKRDWVWKFSMNSGHLIAFYNYTALKLSETADTIIMHQIMIGTSPTTFHASWDFQPKSDLLTLNSSTICCQSKKGSTIYPITPLSLRNVTSTNQNLCSTEYSLQLMFCSYSTQHCGQWHCVWAVWAVMLVLCTEMKYVFDYSIKKVIRIGRQSCN